jgi:type IV secretion system protein VirB5
MRKLRCIFASAWPLALLAGAPAAHAQWAVIDVHAIAQLVQQLRTLQQSLVTAENELRQAQQEYQAITGNRGMQLLLPAVVRNYLPRDWLELEAALTQNGSSPYPGVSAAMQNSMTQNAILRAPRLGQLSGSEAAQIQAERRSTALLQAMAGVALGTESSRFSSLEVLIDTIGRASDQKASLDLQSRIAAEQTMLQTEQAKLGVLYQAAQAQHWVDQQRARELTVAEHGSFELRFEPSL